jgi:hypothetical protein
VEDVASPVWRRLDRAGLDVRGVLSASRYDALVPPAWRVARLLPEARCAIVVGSGGRALWSAFCASPEASRARHPLDAFTQRVLREATDALTQHGVPARALLYHERREGAFADFVALGQAAGLGAPSRLGLLLHPVYGPWLSIRAVLLAALDLDEDAPLGEFAPCDGCAAPCAAACHGGAVPPGGFDAARCAAARSSVAACAAGCDARRACVVGPAHAYTEAQQAHHAAAVAAGPSR